MPTTLVTGGTGFLGSHLARQLAARGDELRLLIRPSNPAEHLSDLKFERADGDVCDRDSVRKSMKGIDRVFHVAGTTSMRRADRCRVFEVNVGGTRNVMEEALRAGVVRVVHTSSCSAVGTAKPHSTIDETAIFKAAHLGIAYVNSKHEAENVAMRVAAQGLPVVVTNPTFVLGPDDPSGTSNRLVTRLLLRRVPGYFDAGLNIVDVRDVAAGHLLADERGHEGERYLFGGRNFTQRRLFTDLARIAGVAAPPLLLNARAALAGAEALERAGIPAPASTDEVRSAMQWWTYRNDKAVDELGWEARPHEETLEETVESQRQRLGSRAEHHQLSDYALRGTGMALKVPMRVLGLGRGAG